MKCIECMNLRTKTFNRDTIKGKPFEIMVPILKALADYGSVQVCWCSKGKLPRRGYIYPSHLIDTKDSKECDILMGKNELLNGVNANQMLEG